jgi:glycosyltransferase involved in cell wall biosynthesis
MMPIAINGRFLTQGMTGVQRFAREITTAADRLMGHDAWPEARLLMPSSVAQSPFAYLKAEAIGQKSGQLWEQWELPKAAKGSFLINLGNTAPLMLGRAQAVVIHDAGVFDTPQLLTVSEFSRGRIAAALGVAPYSIGVLPEGGDHMLRISADSGMLARHDLASGRYALVVGNPAAHKNLAALTSAAALLGQRGLTLAVAGAADPAVFRAGGGPAADAGRILGRVTDAELRALYENALCLIFPSRYEGFGLPPLEAMTCGCPLVAAHAGAVPEVCGEAALWFDPLRPETLAKALERLLDEEGLAAGMRDAGLKRAALYTWEIAALALLSLIRKNAP